MLYNTGEEVQLGDNVEIKLPGTSSDGQIAMVKRIDEDDQFPIKAETMSGLPYQFKSSDLILLSRFKVYVGDIWERTSDDNQLFVIDSIDPIFMRKLGTDYGFMGADRYPAARDVFIEKFMFNRRGPRVGDIRINIKTLQKIEIKELDLSQRDGVKYSPEMESDEFMFRNSIQRIFLTTKLLDNFLTDIAKCQTYKKDGVDYIVDSVGDNNIVKFHKSKTRSNRIVVLESSIRSFKERYSLVGPKPGEKYVHKITRGIYNHDFHKILGITYGKLYALRNNKDKREILRCEFFKNYMLEPKPQAGQIWIDDDNQGIRKKYEIMSQTIGTSIRQLGETLSYRITMERLLTEYGFYSYMPTTGQVFKNYRDDKEVIVRYVSTDNKKRNVHYSRAGITAQNYMESSTLNFFLKDFVYNDSGTEIKLPVPGEKWKSIDTEKSFEISRITPDQNNKLNVYLKGSNVQNNPDVYVGLLYQFLRGFVPIDVRLPKKGDTYKSLIDDSEIILKNVNGDIVYTGDRIYEMQTFIRDFELVSTNVFSDLATLKGEVINKDSILNFIKSLDKKVTEEQVKMLEYLISQKAHVDYKAFETISSVVKKVEFNEALAQMVTLIVNSGHPSGSPENVWFGRRTSLVRALLGKNKESPLAENLLIKIIKEVRTDYDAYFQYQILERGSGKVIEAYYLKDGKLKDAFKPMDRMKYADENFNRVEILLLTLKDEDERLKVLDAIIFDSKFKILKTDIKEWLPLAIEKHSILGEKRMDRFVELFKKNRTKDKEGFLFKKLLPSASENVEYMLKTFQISVNASYNSYTLMHIVSDRTLINNDEVQIMDMIMKHPEYDPNIVDKEKYTALGRCLSFTHAFSDIDVLKRFLLLPKLSVNVIASKNYTYLQLISKNSGLGGLLRTYLTRSDIDVNAKNDKGLTAMHVANYKDAYRALYDKDADINAVDDKGYSVLEMAVDKQQLSKLSWLMFRLELRLTNKGKHIVEYTIERITDYSQLLATVNTFLEVYDVNEMVKNKPLLFVVHYLLPYNKIIEIIERDDFEANLKDGDNNNYLAIVVMNYNTDNLLDDMRLMLIKKLIYKGSDKNKALQIAMNWGLTDVIEILISPRQKKIQDVEKKKRLELDKCSDYKKRVAKMDAEIEELNKLSDKEFEEKIGKAQMSKCQNEMDTITLAPWEAMDYKNTLFLRITDLKGKQRTYCLVEKFYKGESFELNGKKYEEPDEQTTISQYIKKMLYADWVYQSDGSPYSKADVESKSGKGGEPGRNRYVVFTPSDGSTYYVKYDKTLKQIIKRERQRVSSDDYASGYYEINGTIFKLPKGWSLPLAIYISAYKKLAIGNEYGSSGASDSHGNVMVMTYKVDRIVNFNSYDDIDEERECIGTCKKMKF